MHCFCIAPKITVTIWMFYTNLKYSSLTPEASQSQKHNLLMLTNARNALKISIWISWPNQLYIQAQIDAHKRKNVEADLEVIQAKSNLCMYCLYYEDRVSPNHPDDNSKSFFTIDHINFEYVLLHRKTWRAQWMNKRKSNLVGISLWFNVTPL